MEDMRNRIANYLETQGFNRNEFLQNPDDEEYDDFFIIDADQALLLGDRDHPAHPESAEEDLDQFEIAQYIYNNFIAALPAYRQRQQERITLALVAEKPETTIKAKTALRTALNRRFGGGRTKRKKRRRRRKNARTKKRKRSRRRRSRRRKTQRKRRRKR